MKLLEINKENEILGFHEPRLGVPKTNNQLIEIEDSEWEKAFFEIGATHYKDKEFVRVEKEVPPKTVEEYQEELVSLVDLKHQEVEEVLLGNLTPKQIERLKMKYERLKAKKEDTNLFNNLKTKFNKIDKFIAMLEIFNDFVEDLIDKKEFDKVEKAFAIGYTIEIKETTTVDKLQEELDKLK